MDRFSETLRERNERTTADPLQTRTQKKRSELVESLRARNQNSVYQRPRPESESRWSDIFRPPTTEHQTAHNMPGFRAHGGAYTQQPTGQPRAISGPAFPVDNRQLVTPRDPEQVAADRQRSNYSMAQTYTGQQYPEQNPASFGNRDGSDPGGARLGRSREALIRARGAVDENYDTDRFLQMQQARENELASRQALRQQRGLQRGDARHQAQLAQLRGDNQMNPMVAQMMHRNPAMAVQMMRLQQQGNIEAQRLGLQGQGLGLQREQAANDRLMNMARIDQGNRELDLKYDRSAQVDPMQRMQMQMDEANRLQMLKPSLTREQAMEEARQTIDSQLGEQSPQSARTLTSMGVETAAGPQAAPLPTGTPETDPAMQAVDSRAVIDRMLNPQSQFSQALGVLGLQLDRDENGAVLDEPTADDIAAMLWETDPSRLPGGETLGMLRNYVTAQDAVDDDYYIPGQNFGQPGVSRLRAPIIDELMRESDSPFPDRLAALLARSRKADADRRYDRHQMRVNDARGL